MDTLLLATDSSDALLDDEIAWLPDDPIAWIEREFWIPETNAPLKLADYQKAVLKEALRRDGESFVYSLVLWSDLKKSAKSTIAAAVVLWLAWHHEWETCRIVGNDLKQASSRTFYYIERALKLNHRFEPHVNLKINHVLLDNNTSITAIPVDPKGEAGGGDLIVCFTELWAAKNEAAKQLWSETTLSPLKYGKSLRWCESYAGFTGESPILEQLYEQGVQQGRQVDVGIDGLELYANDNARMLALWNTIPRCDWQTDTYYAQEAAVLTPNEFGRIHRNEWASSVSSFLPIEWWDACAGALPPLTTQQPLIVALDGAVTNDSFAVVGVSRNGEITQVRFARHWMPPKGGQIDFSDVEAYLREMARTYNVAVFCFDPMHLYDMAQRLGREGLGFFEPFNQAGDRLIADKELYDTIRDRRIVHDGTPDLREHLMNANQKADGDKLRIVKRSETRKIDLAVALSMANARARFYNIG